MTDKATILQVLEGTVECRRCAVLTAPHPTGEEVSARGTPAHLPHFGPAKNPTIPKT